MKMKLSCLSVLMAALLLAGTASKTIKNKMVEVLTSQATQDRLLTRLPPQPKRIPPRPPVKSDVVFA